MATSASSRAVQAVTVGLCGLLLALGPLTAAPDDRASWLARGYGHLTFWYLCVVVLSTPLAWFHRGTWLAKPLRWRRAIGLATCLPAVLHGGFVLASTPRLRRGDFDASDIAGTVAAIILLALAITSFDPMRRRLGSRWWKRIHTLVIVAFASGTFAAMAAIGSEALQWFTLALALLVIGYRLAYLRARWVRARRRGRSAG